VPDEEEEEGAMLHRSYSTTQMWHEFFGDCIISQNWWPSQLQVPRVPDLSSCVLEDSAQTTTHINQTNPTKYSALHSKHH